MSSKTYAGIGSRDSPEAIVELMTRIAQRLETFGYLLRSGGAHGADEAFSQGCSRKEIYVPWDGYNELPLIFPVPEEAYVIAKQWHPAWAHLTKGIKALMARNTMQILGPDLKSPSDFVICWTPDGCIRHEKRTTRTGGTGQAISIASTNHIPVFNLARQDHRNLLKKDFDPTVLLTPF